MERCGCRLVERARRHIPKADVRIGPIEQLPRPDQSFDVVTGFNAFQFAADFVAALAEARRVTRSGGRVAICNWARIADREVNAIFEPLKELDPRPHEPPPIGEPGVLEASPNRPNSAPNTRAR